MDPYKKSLDAFSRIAEGLNSCMQRILEELKHVKIENYLLRQDHNKLSNEVEKINDRFDELVRKFDERKSSLDLFEFSSSPFERMIDAVRRGSSRSSISRSSIVDFVSSVSSIESGRSGSIVVQLTTSKNWMYFSDVFQKKRRMNSSELVSNQSIEESHHSLTSDSTTLTLKEEVSIRAYK